MNLIVISTDTLRADYLGCYGNQEVQTPNTDRLAQEGVLFENAFAEGLPTLNARRVYFTGKHLFPAWEVREHKGDHLGTQPGWHSFDEEDVTIAETLQARGYTTGLVTDVYHMFKPTGNYHRGFDSWRWIRGQEADPYVTGPRGNVDFSPFVKQGTYERRRFQGLEQYLLNVSGRQSEDDYFTPQVLGTAIEWLESNVDNQPFFLWVDCFDPHEPWDPPRRFADAYCPEYEGIEPIWPSGNVAAYSEDEWRRIRALYMGEITFLDEWVGKFLTRLEELDLTGRTVVAFTSDHGTLMGEQGLIRKRHEMLVQGETRLPLINRTPDKLHAGHRVSAFVQAPDFMPTWLRLIGEAPPQAATGGDMWPLVTGEAQTVHDYVVTAYGAYVSIRDKEWNYIRQVGRLGPGEQAAPPRLYNHATDGLEVTDLIQKHADVVGRMEHRLAKRLRGELTQADD